MEGKLTESYVKADENLTKDKLRTLGDCLRYYSESLNDNASVIFASKDGNGRKEVVTWKDLYDKTSAVAKSLVKLGLKQNEFVAINIRPCPEWLYLAFGTILAGARVAPIVFTYTDGSDLVAIMKQLETCSVLALDPGEGNSNWEIVEKLLSSYEADGTASSTKMPYLRHILGCRFPKHIAELRSVESLVQANVDEIQLPDPDQNDIVIVFQTSGSTGTPKLVAHDQSSLLFTRKLVISATNENYICYNDRPFNWMGGFPFSVTYGHTRVAVSGFGPPAEDSLKRMIDIIMEEKCVFAAALAPRLRSLIKIQGTLPDGWPVTMLMTGGQPMTTEICGALGKACKMLLCSYGASEIMAVARTIITDPAAFWNNFCGNVVPGTGVEIKIVDEKGSTLPVNSQGEVLVRGPGMFTEYLNDPAKTSDAMTEDGWFKTGDLGVMTEYGSIFVGGRKNNVIVSGGLKVLPEMIEDIIKTFPEVEDAIVVPVADKDYFQVLCACVKISKGSSVSEEVLNSNLKRMYNDKPGLFTVLPKFYLLLESFPHTRSGKVNRKDLERLAADRFK